MKRLRTGEGSRLPLGQSWDSNPDLLTLRDPLPPSPCRPGAWLSRWTPFEDNRLPWEIEEHSRGWGGGERWHVGPGGAGGLSVEKGKVSRAEGAVRSSEREA